MISSDIYSNLESVASQALLQFGGPVQVGDQTAAATYRRLEAIVEHLPTNEQVAEAAKEFRHAANVVVALKYEGGLDDQIPQAAEVMKERGAALLAMLGALK